MLVAICAVLKNQEKIGYSNLKMFFLLFSSFPAAGKQYRVSQHDLPHLKLSGDSGVVGIVECFTCLASSWYQAWPWEHSERVEVQLFVLKL